MDSYTFCEVLGPEKGNKILRDHWSKFITEEKIKKIAESGVQMVRLPIGDWTLNPYGPYVGCMEGAAEYIDWFYDMCAKY